MNAVAKIMDLVRPRREVGVVNDDFPLPAIDELDDETGQRMQFAAARSLDDQIHRVIDRNADGVNRLAMQVRRDSDLLLSLGISDPFASKAGTLAQRALELANSKRGMNLKAEAHNSTTNERAKLVSKAMTLATRAETLLTYAKSVNAPAIEEALKIQSRLLNDLATSSYGPRLAAN